MPTIDYGPSLAPRAARGGKCVRCHRQTWDEKRHCPKHVEHERYASEILAQLVVAHAEVARVAKYGWTEVDVEGLLARETLAIIGRLGPTNKQGLVKELRQFVGKNQQAVLEYGQALVHAGLAKWLRGERGIRLAAADWSD